MTVRTLIMGIGNVLWADEGFGVRCVEELSEKWSFPDNVKLLDGGTQGLYLLPFLEEADVLVVFDAVDYGLLPGTLKIVAFTSSSSSSLVYSPRQDSTKSS